MGRKPVAAAEQSNQKSAPAAQQAHVPRLAVGTGSGASPAVEAAGAHASSDVGLATRPALTPLDFEQVYETEFDFVWRSLRLLGVEPHAVEDAIQDVFSVVSRRLGEFEGRSALRTWLFAILQRIAGNQRRRWRRKQRQLTTLDDELLSQLPTQHTQLEAAESIDVVQRFCDSLEVEWRAVFVLALLEQLPAPEVSQALGIPVNTVYSRVRQLREGLRRRLASEELGRG